MEEIILYEFTKYEISSFILFLLYLIYGYSLNNSKITGFDISSEMIVTFTKLIYLKYIYKSIKVVEYNEDMIY